MNPKHSLYLLLPFFTTFTWCLPTPSLELDDPSTALAARNAGGIDLTKRQAQIAAVIAIADAVVDVVKEIELSNGDYEAQFVEDTVNNFVAEYPGWNILVYHDQDSDYALPGSAQHSHYELPVYLLFSYGYEIWVWKQGGTAWFQRAGDGGFSQWAVAGCLDTPDGSPAGYVHFC